MKKLLTPFLLNTGLLHGSVFCPEVDVLFDPEEADLARIRARGSAFGERASSRNPQLENNQPKR